MTRLALPGRAPVTVSAVMPTYNKGAHLAAAVDSIRRQTFTDWELIVVDDGSTDGSAALLAGCDDPRIVLHTLSENGGRSRARNIALAQAAGRYIAICDSDDVSAPTRFERQVSFLDANPDVGVVSAWIQAFSGERTVRMQFPLDRAAIARRFAKGKMAIAHGASMVRAECFERLGTYCEDLHFAEDFELFRRFSAHYGFCTLPEVLLDYRHDIGMAALRNWDKTSCAHRYAIYRSEHGNGGGLTLDQFSRKWQTRSAVYTLDLLRSVQYHLRARVFSRYELR